MTILIQSCYKSVLDMTSRDSALTSFWCVDQLFGSYLCQCAVSTRFESIYLVYCSSNIFKIAHFVILRAIQFGSEGLKIQSEL